ENAVTLFPTNEAEDAVARALVSAADPWAPGKRSSYSFGLAADAHLQVIQHCRDGAAATFGLEAEVDEALINSDDRRTQEGVLARGRRVEPQRIRMYIGTIPESGACTNLRSAGAKIDTNVDSSARGL